MLDPILARALADGALLVTPNRRLARHLAAAYDRLQQASGRRAWRAPQAMPWPSFVERLWQDALHGGAMEAPPLLLDPPVVARLWETAIEEEGDPLVDPAGAARSAADAWRLFHEHRRDESETVAAWSRGSGGDDARVFARWAGRYAAGLKRRGQVDLALATDRLRSLTGAVVEQGMPAIVLAGFRMLSQQQQRLVAALRGAGAEVHVVEIARAAASRTERIEADDPDDELRQAFAWARRQVEAGAERVGIVVRDLARRRDAAIACAEDALCPELAGDASAPRPYDISLGTPLSEAPIVFAALALIRLAHAPIALDDACVLLRSPYLPNGDTSWRERGALERGWRERGARMRSWRDLIVDLGAYDFPLSQRFATAPLVGDRRRPAHEWMVAWRGWLDAVGFPGERALSSAEWQAREAWSRLLGQFARLDAIAPSLTPARAIDMLVAMGSELVFQPEGPVAPVHVLGLLEAPGLDFDALWIAGLSADAWPPPARPAPLLPIAWQRERGVPGADAEGERSFAADLMDDFRGGAKVLVASYPRREEDYEHLASPLIAAWPELAREAFGAAEPRPLAIAKSAMLESFDDTRAPALADGTAVRGGASLIESQSACPFQAFGRYRAGAGSWAPLPDGLTPAERGKLLHDAFARLWTPPVDSVDLAREAPEAVAVRIAAAVDGAMASLRGLRRKMLPGAVYAAEVSRLRRLLRDWIEAVEKERPPFTVALTEWKTQHRLGGLELRLRFDRVDALADRGVAIIDYKSGEAAPPARWFAERPSGTQLPLYAGAWREQKREEPVRALAYAIPKGGAMRVRGIAADERVWPGLEVVTRLRGAGANGWESALARLDDRLSDIAREFREGHASVTPRDGACCRACDLQRFCRVQRLDADEAGAAHE